MQTWLHGSHTFFSRLISMPSTEPLSSMFFTALDSTLNLCHNITADLSEKKIFEMSWFRKIMNLVNHTTHRGEHLAPYQSSPGLQFLLRKIILNNHFFTDVVSPLSQKDLVTHIAYKHWQIPGSHLKECVVINCLNCCQNYFLFNWASQNYGFHLHCNFHGTHVQQRNICNQTSHLLIK